jgi:hypothetical protein
MPQQPEFFLQDTFYITYLQLLQNKTTTILTFATLSVVLLYSTIGKKNKRLKMLFFVLFFYQPRCPPLATISAGCAAAASIDAI